MAFIFRNSRMNRSRLLKNIFFN